MSETNYMDGFKLNITYFKLKAKINDLINTVLAILILWHRNRVSFVSNDK